MHLGPFTVLTANNWLDLRAAAEYAGVSNVALVAAITARDVRATTTHPDRPGDWMVPLAEVDQWMRHRQPASATSW